jgi:hypothetical protein
VRAIDVRNILRFNTRMGMYVCPSDRANVVAFLHGNEYGAAGECQFTKILGDHLAKKHRVKSGAIGWPDQIAQLAKRRSLDWMEMYLLVSSEVLSAAVGSSKANAEPEVAPDWGGIT